MTPALFLADRDALRDDRVVLDGAEGRHAADVRRVRPGEAVDVTDGAGLLVRAVVAEVVRGRVVLEVTERVDVPAPQPRMVVVQALAKGGRDEAAAAAMTEVGVDEVLGWQAARCVAHWTDRTAAKWRATVREAAKQARRTWIPQVGGPLTTSDVTARLSAAALGVVLHEGATEPLVGLGSLEAGEIVVVVGPEGGITAGELTAFAASGAHVCRLGATVLRTSTAGVAALSVLSAATRWR